MLSFRPSSPSKSSARRCPITGDGDAPAAVQLTATVESSDDARRISDALLTRRLAACVQVVGPITSRYWWNDEITESTEHLLLVKTSAARADEAVAAIVDAHPYDVPEVLVTPVVGGHRAYLDWIAESVDG